MKTYGILNTERQTRHAGIRPQHPADGGLRPHHRGPRRAHPLRQNHRVHHGQLLPLPARRGRLQAQVVGPRGHDVGLQTGHRLPLRDSAPRQTALPPRQGGIPELQDTLPALWPYAGGNDRKGGRLPRRRGTRGVDIHDSQPNEEVLPDLEQGSGGRPQDIR